MCLESFNYALIEGLKERRGIWGHEKNLYNGVGILEFFTAMDWGIIQINKTLKAMFLPWR